MIVAYGSEQPDPYPRWADLGLSDDFQEAHDLLIGRRAVVRIVCLGVKGVVSLVCKA